MMLDQIERRQAQLLALRDQKRSPVVAVVPPSLDPVGEESLPASSELLSEPVVEAAVPVEPEPAPEVVAIAPEPSNDVEPKAVTKTIGIAVPLPLYDRLAALKSKDTPGRQTMKQLALTAVEAGLTTLEA